MVNLLLWKTLPLHPLHYEQATLAITFTITSPVDCQKVTM